MVNYCCELALKARYMSSALLRIYIVAEAEDILLELIYELECSLYLYSFTLLLKIYYIMYTLFSFVEILYI